MYVKLWELIKPRLVLGENASQAAQFASSGSSQGGILPYSLALAPAITQQGSSQLLPAEWHRPISHRMVLMKHAGDTARRFYQYLQTAAAQRIFLQYGFDSPG
jgi:molybdate transport system substrate-binding protein